MSDIITGQDGGCFYCGKPIFSLRRVSGKYDNGEFTTLTVAICKDCEAKK